MPRCTPGVLIEGDVSIIMFIMWLDDREKLRGAEPIVIDAVSPTAVFVARNKAELVQEQVRRYVAASATLKNKTHVDEEDDGLGARRQPEAEAAAPNRAPRKPRSKARSPKAAAASGAAAGASADASARDELPVTGRSLAGRVRRRSAKSAAAAASAELEREALGEDEDHDDGADGEGSGAAAAPAYVDDGDDDDDDDDDDEFAEEPNDDDFEA